AVRARRCRGSTSRPRAAMPMAPGRTDRSYLEHPLRQLRERFFDALAGFGARAHDRPAVLGEPPDGAVVEVPLVREIRLVEDEDERGTADDVAGLRLELPRHVERERTRAVG